MRTSIAFSLLLILFCTSCQKELHFPVVPVAPVPQDSTLLIQYTEADSLPGQPPVVTRMIYFGYDAARRLTSMKTVFSADSIQNLYNYHLYTFGYNGTDTLPATQVHEYKDGNPASTYNYQFDTTYYSFSGLELTTDSTRFRLQDNSGSRYYFSTGRYQYSNNNIIVSKYESLTATRTLDSIISTQTNGLRSAQRLVTYALPAMQLTDGFNFNFAYDAHPNPFYGIAAIRFTRLAFEYENGIAAGLQRNNLSSVFQQTFGSISNSTSENISYTYRRDGFPVELYSMGTYNGGVQRNVKGIFKYGIR